MMFNDARVVVINSDEFDHSAHLPAKEITLALWRE